MLNEPRIYRHSSFQIGIVVFLFGILGVGLLVTIGASGYLFLIPFVVFYAIIFLTIIYYMTTKINISDNEISIQTILATKSLTWSEINRVSGRGYAIKLHNFDGDVTISPSPQLPGYEEIVEQIGAKRPDLFNPLEYGEMTKSLAGLILTPIIGITLIGSAFLAFIQDGSSDVLVPFIMFFVFGIFFIGMVFTSPRAVTIEGNSIVIGYLLSQKTYRADEIASIDLRYTQTRNGKNYFAAIELANKKSIRISGLRPNLPVTYLVLKNWHKKNAVMAQMVR